MQPQSDSDYKKIFTQLIKKQMIVLGPDITLAKVKNVQGIQVNEQGEVTDIQGDGQALLQLLINQFVELSGAIVKKTMESILTTYPAMAGMAVGAVAPQMTPQTPVQSASTPPREQSPSQQEPVVLGANPFSDSFSTPAQAQQETSSTDQNNSQMPKDDMDTINKALSELNTASNMTPSQTPLENKSSGVQESKSN